MLGDLIRSISAVFGKSQEMAVNSGFAHMQDYFNACKNFKKTACENFHDEATFHALRFKPVSIFVGSVSPRVGAFA